MIKRLPFKLPLLVLIVLLAMSTFWLDLAVKPSSTVAEQDGSVRRDPDYVIENFSVMRMNQDGVARHTLSAKRLLHYPDNNNSDLEQPRLVNADPGKPVVRIMADQGELPSNSDDVYLAGNVTVQREAGNGRGRITLFTSSLHIIPEDDIAKTDKLVTITDANTVINAVGMELNDRTHTTRLLSQVRVAHNKAR